jgi:predicted ATP-grasp superfamily ATP-dependent carboligase
MTKKTSERVLVFGDDMRIFLAVVRSLGRAGKEVHAVPFNWRAPALKSKYIDVIHRLPRYSDNPDVWCAAVSRLLQSENYDLVLPNCDDRAILAFHLHRKDFAAYPIAIPDVEIMDLLFDKELTRELATRCDVPIVPGRPLTENDAAGDLIACYGLPLVLKPRRSYWPDKLDGWGKVFIAESEDDAAKVLAGLHDRPRYLVEGYFQGVGVGVSVLAEKGIVLQAFQHRRLREGWAGSSSYRVSEAVNPALYEACKKICNYTKLTGVCMFEFRFNPRTREWVLLETNARFWGSLPLPVSLGVDFPLHLYDLLVHKRHHTPMPYRYGVRSRNVALDGLNLLASLRRLRGNKCGTWLGEIGQFITQPASWLTGRERSDSFVIDDLRPAFAECAQLIMSLHRRHLRGRGVLARRRSEQTA